MLLALYGLFGRSAFPLLGEQDGGGGCETCQAGAKGEGKASPLHVTMIEVMQNSYGRGSEKRRQPQAGRTNAVVSAMQFTTHRA